MDFCKNMGKSVGKNISKNVIDKYSQKLLDHAKQFATDALKFTSKRVIYKIAESPDDLIGNKIANTITKVSKKNYNKIIQRQLQISLIKKFL